MAAPWDAIEEACHCGHRRGDHMMARYECRHWRTCHCGRFGLKEFLVTDANEGAALTKLEEVKK